MARKKPKKQNEQQKRLRVTDEAGWTHIIKGSRAQRHQRHVSLNESLEPTEPPDGLTVDKMKEKFEKFCRHWKESESFGIFKLMLEEGLLACEKVNLTRCVCLGLGSLGGRDASMYELVFLYTALEILGLSGVICGRNDQQLTFLQERNMKSQTSTSRTQFSTPWTKHSWSPWATRYARPPTLLARSHPRPLSSPPISKSGPVPWLSKLPRSYTSETT